jgi:hypothetical protein
MQLFSHTLEKEKPVFGVFIRITRKNGPVTLEHSLPAISADSHYNYGY